MMPRIEAQETLAAVNRAALTHNVGFRTEEDRQQAIEHVESRARGEAPAAPQPADPAELAAMGFAVETEEGVDAVIGDLAAWLDQGQEQAVPSSSAAVGEQADG